MAHDTVALTYEFGARTMGYDVTVETYSALAGSSGDRLAAGESVGSIIAGSAVDMGANAVTAGLYGTGKEYVHTYNDFQSGKIDINGVEDRLAIAAGGLILNAAMTSAGSKARGRRLDGQADEHAVAQLGDGERHPGAQQAALGRRQHG